MSDENTTEPVIAANAALRELILKLRSSVASEQALKDATAAIEQASAALAPHVAEGSGWSTVTIGDDNLSLPLQEDDITTIMPYSPVSGLRNAISPKIKLWRDGDNVRGEAFFSPTYAGPPGSVHGGVIASVFDEVLAMANMIVGTGGFTGTLTIRYHRLTPLNRPIELFSENVRRDGRKQLCRGEMRVDGEVTATAEGLFISKGKELDDL